MLLKPAERALLLNILPPAEGNAIFLRSVRRLRHDLAFSDEESRRWKVKNHPSGLITWDGDEAVEIVMNEVGIEYVKRSLVAAENAGKLHEGILSVYDQFFPEV